MSSYLRVNLRPLAKAAALAVIIFELAGIWNEVHQTRREQVKNITYSLPKDRRDALKGTPASKRMESTAFVDGDVSIDGTVEVEQPVEVEIDQ
jgi:hypothetical protein